MRHRALEYLEVALAADPGSVYTLFVKIKVLLMRRDAGAATQELQRLLACEEFNLDLLRVKRAILPCPCLGEPPPMV